MGMGTAAKVTSRGVSNVTIQQTIDAALQFSQVHKQLDEAHQKSVQSPREGSQHVPLEQNGLDRGTVNKRSCPKTQQRAVVRGGPFRKKQRRGEAPLLQSTPNLSRRPPRVLTAPIRRQAPAGGGAPAPSPRISRLGAGAADLSRGRPHLHRRATERRWHVGAGRKDALRHRGDPTNDGQATDLHLGHKRHRVARKVVGDVQK